MLLWIALAVLTAAVLGSLLQPLARGGESDLRPEDADLAVYKDQLAEIEADKARGLIGADEARSARAEVARRLIKISESGAEAVNTISPAAGLLKPRYVIAVVAVLLPLVSAGVYLRLGAPNVPDMPLAARLDAPADQAPVLQMIAKVEQRLNQYPEDGKGWDVIAPIYMSLGRYPNAAEAFGNAMRILGETPQRLAGYAQAALLAGDGVVSDDVRRAALKLLELEPGRSDAQLWLALGDEQEGKLAGALASYRRILAGAPAEWPWRAATEERIRAMQARLAGVPLAEGAKTSDALAAEPTVRPNGPSAADVAAARDMSPDQQSVMINDMVGRLAKRLDRDGKDLAGWLQLMRAYKVLGRSEDAAKALANAKRNFADDAKALNEIDAAARNLGIAS